MLVKYVAKRGKRSSTTGSRGGAALCSVAHMRLAKGTNTKKIKTETAGLFEEKLG